MRADGHYPFILILLVLLLLFAILVSTTMGFMRIEPATIIKIVYAKIFNLPELLTNLQEAVPYVVMDVRLPRILLAAIVGAGLALAGVVYQGILINPLADPYTLGISSGAAFGASLALLASLEWAGYFSTPLFAFIGALITLVVVLRLAVFNGQISTQTLILAGVIVSAILSAGISFIKYIADEQVAVIIFWLMGSFNAATWTSVAIAFASLSFCLGVTFFYSRDLNIISLGKRSADTLGVETAKVRKILLVTASFMAAIAVSLAGIIGFVGLVVPHLMRYMVGPDNRKLIFTSSLGGAFLLLLADTTTRAILPVEIPIGILTALIGGPFFCLIFRQKQKGSYNG